MASLTPGILSKLLQNQHNPTVKVAGDHRTPLLQVIAIIPQHDVFDFAKRNKGFYLRLSDSLHSAYVSVPEPQLDLILNDKIQLGQFVHVTRFDPGSPVPIVCGIKPVPKRRPCVGDPKDLISSDVLVIKGNNNRRLSLSNSKVLDAPVEMRRLSLDCSSRRSWDRSPAPEVKHRKACSTLCSTPVRSVKKSSLVKDLVLKPPNLNPAPLKNKNGIVSDKLISKPVKKDLKASFDSVPVPANLTKVPINASVRTCPGSKISWDVVSPTIRQLGKEAISHRNMGFSSAVHALKDCSAMENILQCMSRFAEICELAATSRNPLVEQFLNYYHKLQTSAAVVNTLVDSKLTVDKTKGQPRNSALWVQAALESNLGNFTLFTMEESKKIQDSEGNYHIVLDNGSDKIQVENRSPGNKKIPRTPEPAVSRGRRGGPSPRSAMKTTIPERVKWSKGSGLKETARLGEELLLTSRKWFLNYLEESLDKRFWVSKGEDSGVAVGLLGQLKRVNQWLDDSVRGDENVENLRKKIYGFLLDRVQKATT
ncbi:hypothetical protein QVD17_35145 [Tagetes erecta]|uniref:DUF936 family protein n=1 Tax=Tagetes erecta TaxID=13708 RepID=A0AAD8NMB1_TARER|nr:hypothetical protein QVD17_35145 [Tagetes erecta]